MRIGVVGVLLASLSSLACGQSTTSGSASTDASAGDASGTEGGADGSAEAGTCRTNVDHRPGAQACPSHADAGVIEAGPSTCGQTIVPSDACLSDGQCKGAHDALGVCVCESPHGNGCGVGVVTGNVCVPSNCHVDSDCTACGTCRVESSCGDVTGYYCGTPFDECSSNAGCPGGFCTFRGDHFACQNFGCPG